MAEERMDELVRMYKELENSVIERHESSINLREQAMEELEREFTRFRNSPDYRQFSDTEKIDMERRYNEAMNALEKGIDSQRELITLIRSEKECLDRLVTNIKSECNRLGD